MKNPPKSSATKGDKASAVDKPRPGSREVDWADRLRKMYDDVVAEPLPDSINDLLNRLDEAAGDDRKS